ncbi:hypothetical protein SAMN04488595_11867 [Ralstonia sp. 25mfcol4.1]|uniref:hypothetical protein n=1 Tax=Ralstonia sp. 25mfcol4.1 TaxID=1761899 RepID=UPI00048F520C|nr:hypothetical protein [Ralstonia sp. 25mfcol4.1]SDP72602.1 hypothetical protein SAMN04488595_11867 [Ralstonia sp. 25mfcol4.1]
MVELQQVERVPFYRDIELCMAQCAKARPAQMSRQQLEDLRAHCSSVAKTREWGMPGISALFDKAISPATTGTLAKDADAR